MAIRVLKRGKINITTTFVVYWLNPFTKKRESKSFYTMHDAEKYDSIIKHQLKFERDIFRRDDISSVVIDEETETLETVFLKYLKGRQFKKENFIKTHLAVKGIIAKYGTTPVSEISRKFLGEIAEELLQMGNKPSTVKRKMGIIRTSLSWAEKNELLDSVPRLPDLPSVQLVTPDPLSQEEIESICKVAEPHIKRVTILGSQLGMRIGRSELFKMQWQNVYLKQAKIRIPNAEKGINEPWRELPLRPELISILEGWKEEDESLGISYLISWKGQQVGSIKNSWETALTRAEVPYRNPYVLRHTFATNAIKAGIDYKTVAFMMGHKNPRMIMERYQHVLDEQKQRAVLALPMPPPLK